MKPRSVLLPAVVAALVALPGAASAATACNLVKDAANDAAVGNPASPAKTPAFDIRSLDVASGKKTFVVVMRMGTTNLSGDPAATLGMTWNVTFKVADTSLRFNRQVGPNGTVIGESAQANGNPIAGLKVTTAGNAITWTVPRTGVPKLKKGAVVTSFYASTSAPTAAYDSAPDNGVASGARYTDGQKSCVKAA